ncbi:MAG TPA: hypothetical protein VK815_08780 [Candidatus Acidoferrales bacterium]|jgi:hypothetical protein|nr:hypothetical protein [Candidatus Acidoferrales bacterium]
MFSIVRDTHLGPKVVSDEGFEVAFFSNGVDGLGVMYQDNKDRYIVLDAFDRLSASGRSVPNEFIVEVPSRLERKPAKDPEFMTEAEVSQILDKIQQALLFQGLKVTFHFYGSPVS